MTENGKEFLLRWLVSGDVFGLAALLNNPPPYMGSVQVTEESEVYLWKHERVCELFGIYPQIVQNALRINFGLSGGLCRAPCHPAYAKG